VNNLWEVSFADLITVVTCGVIMVSFVKDQQIDNLITGEANSLKKTQSVDSQIVLMPADILDARVISDLKLRINKGEKISLRISERS
jgi:hypothetical protein